MKNLWQYLFVASLLAVQAYSQTTTVTTETSNNTSANSAFPGFTDFRTNDPTTTPNVTLGSVLETNPFDPIPGNVSKVNVHSLMYPGFNGKILVETQTWFCTSSTQDGSFIRMYSTQNTHSFAQCGAHLDVKYDSNDATHANAAIDDMVARGFDGFIADVAGSPNDCRSGADDTPPITFAAPCPSKVGLVDGAVQAMMARVNSTYASQFQFMLMEDQSAFDGGENCGATDKNQPLCIAQKIESDISYYNSTYFFINPSTYLKNVTSPMVAFFVADEHQGTDPVTGAPLNPLDLSQCDGGPTACTFENGSTCGGLDPNNSSVSQCWTAIWDAVRAHAPVPITMIFRNQGGLTHEQSDGSFQWVDVRTETGSLLTTTTQEDWENKTELDDFYKAAMASPKIAFGIAKKGFDREDAPFSDNPLGSGHVAAQQCGQVWLNSFQRPSLDGFSSSHQIQFMIAGTWDDYEEGTEIETGIDNCITVGADQVHSISGDSGVDGMVESLVSGNDPHWTGTTIDHYAAYYSTDGQNLTVLQDPVANCSSQAECDVDVISNATLPNGTYQIFMKAVGKPSIMNHLSGPVSITIKNFGLRYDGINQAIDVAARQGYSGSVALAATPPAGWSVALNPTTVVGAGTSVATITRPPNSPSGCYPITVNGTDGTTTSTIDFFNCFFTDKDIYFVVPFAPSSAAVTAGGSAAFSATIAPNGGFTDTVNLSATGLPSGARASFSPATLTGGNGTTQMTLSTATTTPPGIYTITINAIGGGFNLAQSVTVTVNAAPPPRSGNPCPPPRPCSL